MANRECRGTRVKPAMNDQERLRRASKTNIRGRLMGFKHAYDKDPLKEVFIRFPF